MNYRGLIPCGSVFQWPHQRWLMQESRRCRADVASPSLCHRQAPRSTAEENRVSEPVEKATVMPFDESPGSMTERYRDREYLQTADFAVTDL
ncbi:unnamed protein product, partial [Nesidiocoris tenuis]